MSRVLVLGRREGIASAVAQGLDGPATVDVCEQIQQAVEWAASACGALEGYDAILCQAERADELSMVVRLRKRDPDTPIVIVSGRADHPDFRELACRMGASAVLSSASDPHSVGQAVLRAAEAGRAARLMRTTVERTSRTAAEIRVLAARQGVLAARSLRLARSGRTRGV